jgi:phosphate transport system protein
MQKEHIASAFDRDLEAVQAMIMRMGGLVETALSDAFRALDSKDEVLADQVRANDGAIDLLEEQVNSECARLIALRQPMGADLRVVLTVMIWNVAATMPRTLQKGPSCWSVLPPFKGPMGRSSGWANKLAFC